MFAPRPAETAATVPGAVRAGGEQSDGAHGAGDRTGEMVSGPKGRVWGFPPYSKAVRAFGSKVAPLRRFEVEVRDGAIWLV